MKLKEHVEAICLSLNSATQGPFLFDEKTEKEVNKNDIEHFVIVHAMHPAGILGELTYSPKKRKTKKKEVQEEEDLLAQESADEEIDDEQELNRHEEKIKLSPDRELRLIASMRKINQPSLKILSDNGWFLCPIYKGMCDLRPMVLQKLDRNKGYRSIISKEELFTFPEGALPFNEGNLSEYETNSLFILNKMFDSLDNHYGLYAESIFVHKKIDMKKHDLKSALSRLETTQRTRIKLGNILVDEVLIHVGQERYVSNKEKIAILKKDKKMGDEMKDYELDEVHIIDFIVKAYKKVNEKAVAMGKSTIPLNREDTFNTVMKAVLADDEAEHEKMADDLIQSKTEQREKDESVEIPSYEDAYEMTDLFNSQDYINSFVTYMNIKIYMVALDNETDARKVVTRLVHDNPIWEFGQGVKGLGEVTCAYLEANIDWRATVHPSSVIRYLGLDNVTDTPKRKDKETLSDKYMRSYIDLIYLDVLRKVSRSNEKGIEINEDTYDFNFRTDVLHNYSDYSIALSFCKSEFHGLHTSEIADKIETYDFNDIAKYSDFVDLLHRLWLIMDVVYYPNNGISVPAVKKRARNKGDLVTTSYIDKTGHVNFKKSMGYNAKLKSRVVEITFETMSKAGNEYYVGNKKTGVKGIYMNNKERQRKKYEEQGIDPDTMKWLIHLRARRLAMQVLIEDLWMARRRQLHLPLNGGTFYEAKLHGSHGHGFDPAAISI